MVEPAPDSWGVVLDENSPYKGKVTAYDSPIYIADAALYLKATQPDLDITDPYELDDEQFNAAVDLLKQQRPNHRRVLVGLHQGDQAAFTNGNSVLGTTWQVIANLLDGATKVKVETILPEGGLDRLVGHLDDRVEGRAPELHVHVDEPHHLAGGERARWRSGSGRRRRTRRPAT